MKYILKFEFINPDDGTSTKIERTFDDYMDKEIATLAAELANCLKACGYSEKTVDQYILSDF